MIVLFIISSLYYVFFIAYIDEPLKMVFKLIPMILVLLIALLSNASNTKFYKLIVLIGLIFCAIGDYTLQWFIIGLTSFLIGHLFYIRAFLSTNEQKTPSAAKILLIIFGLVMAFFILSAIIQTGNYVLAIAVFCYIAVILTMGWTSFRTNSKFAIIGAFLFIISDSVLAINKFVIPVEFSHQLIMSTYYGAQIFIALSIVNYSAFKSKGVQ
ncbi:membrane protein [Ureibacillus manganicus DSM 26584]|uniref:Membrane protein n=2 Tax=Ureibacillus TaxID=160795 RepID=A0A0A3I3I6_9BACL|nr:membrane protein [Ureibacillus manganicus DSM 26584]